MDKKRPPDGEDVVENAKSNKKETIFNRKMSNIQVIAHQLLEQFVPVQFPDQRARIIEIRNVGRVLGEDVPYNLIDGVIPLF